MHVKLSRFLPQYFRIKIGKWILHIRNCSYLTNTYIYTSTYLWVEQLQINSKNTVLITTQHNEALYMNEKKRNILCLLCEYLRFVVVIVTMARWPKICNPHANWLKHSSIHLTRHNSNVFSHNHTHISI